MACLQSQKRKEWESYYFLNSNYDQYLKDAKLIKRLAKLEFPAYSGEICELSLINVDNVIFLGEWNDGVVGEQKTVETVETQNNAALSSAERKL